MRGCSGLSRKTLSLDLEFESIETHRPLYRVPEATAFVLAFLRQRLPAHHQSDPNRVNDALSRVVSVEEGARILIASGGVAGQVSETLRTVR